MAEKYFLYILLSSYVCAPIDFCDTVFHYDLLSYILHKLELHIGVLLFFQILIKTA